MPVMDGLEATRLIREHEQRNNISPRGRHTIIGMSANSEGDTSVAAKEAGMDCFLPKPFTLEAVAFNLHDIQKRQTKKNDTH